MRIINNIDGTYFEFDGIRYFKNFTSVVNGNRIKILNVYDSKIQLLDLTLYNDVTLDGIIYTNVADLQEALLPVIYAIDVNVIINQTDHLLLQNIGVKTHAEIDAELTALNNSVNGNSIIKEYVDASFNWIPGTYSYNVTVRSFYKNGILHNTVINSIVTSDVADGVDRIDGIVINENETITIIKGVPALAEVDADTQLLITFYTVTAGTTQPIGVSEVLWYNENLQEVGGEKNSVANNPPFVTLDSLEQSSVGTKSIKIVSRNSATLTSTIKYLGSNLSNVLVDVYLLNSTSNQLRFQLWIGPMRVGEIYIQHGTFNFNAYLINQWQTITIPGLAFRSGVAWGNYEYDFLFVGNYKSGTTVYFDNIRFQQGLNEVITTPTNYELLANKQNSLATDGTGAKYPTVDAVNAGLATKLNAADYNQHFKGIYLSLAALNIAHPTASVGDYAQVNEVGVTDVINYNWDAEENIWVANAVAGSGATNTDQLPEGTSNLYFTTARVLNTLLTGISFLTGTSVVATDSILVAFGKLQKQITDALTAIATKQNTLVSGTNIKTVNGNSLLGSGDLAIVSGVDSPISKITLTDATTTVWDFSTSPFAEWIIAGNRTLSVTNLPVGQAATGIIKIIQNGTGGFTPILSGVSNDVSMRLNANDKNELGFYWDGYELFWSSSYANSSSNYGDSLATPSGFSIGAITETSAVLNWGSVSNATDYTLERSLTTNFSSVTTILSNVNILTITDSGLSNGTQYFYRIKANAVGYISSNYIIVSVNTLGYLTWLTLGTNATHKAEQINSNKGLRKITTTTGWAMNANQTAVSNEVLSTGKRVFFKLNQVSKAAVIFLGGVTPITIDGATTPPIPFGFYIGYALTAYFGTNENRVASNSPQKSYLANEWGAIYYNGSSIEYQHSSDGITFTTWKTSANVPTGSYNIQVQFYNGQPFEISEIKII